MARDSKGLTQTDLGSRIGQPQSAVSRIERGGDLRLSTLLEMARVLAMEPMLIPKHLVPAVQALVGHATSRSGVPAFDSAYVSDENRPVLCLSFYDAYRNPVTNVRPVTRRLPPFFSNLFPEGQLRQFIDTKVIAAG